MDLAVAVGDHGAICCSCRILQCPVRTRLALRMMPGNPETLEFPEMSTNNRHQTQLNTPKPD